MISGTGERALRALRQNFNIIEPRVGEQSRPQAPVVPQTSGGPPIRAIDLAPIDEGCYSVHLLPMCFGLLYMTH